MIRAIDLDLVLVRHGEPEGDWRGRFLGRCDPTLGETGREQVRVLAEALPGLLAGSQPRAVHASPLRRAMESAGPVAAGFSLPIEVDARLQEIDFGTWDGRHRDEVEREEPGGPASWFADPAAVAPGGGETFVDVAERVGGWLDSLEAGEGPIILVAHFGVCAVCAALLLGLPLGQADRLCLHRGQSGRIHHGVLNWWGLPTRDPARSAFNERRAS
jgi:broad specificity phosphatase PhoE